MNKIRHYLLGCIIIVCLLLTSCKGDDPVTTEQVEELIKQHLTLGDSSVKIESFLTSNDMIFTYDKYVSRYQCIIRDTSKGEQVDSAIIIYLYVDEDKNFTKSEVIESFTSP